MKYKWFVQTLAIGLLLCGCSISERGMLPEETEILTVTELVEAETTLPPTEIEKPLHAEFYHPEYSLEQIQAYFQEVVLNVEYSDGIGDVTLVQKWTEPIGYRIYGAPTEEDLSVLNTLFAQLNQITGFPGFYTAEAEGLESLRISFLDSEIFRDSFSSAVGGEEVNGATEYWYYTETNEIHSARIGYRTDIDQSIRNSILLEEIINTLGISDTVLREDSVTYQYTDDNTALSDVDWILLKLLYHPRMRCGMDAEACAELIRQLYH